MFDQSLNTARVLSEPIIVYDILSVTSHNEYGIYLDEYFIKGENLTPMLKKAEKMTIYYTGIGLRLEEYANDCFQKGESLKGMILDAIGSHLAEKLASSFLQTSK
jgi:hypothetical protein